MRGQTGGGWTAWAAGLALCGLLAGGYRGAISAADDGPGKSGNGPESPTPADEARALVESLEARLKEAQADLWRAQGLLALLEGRGPNPAGRAGARAETGDLEGVWRIVGIGGNRAGGAFAKPPYDEYKIMTSGHYLWLSFNPVTGEVLRSGGGTYSLKDGTYKAHVDYSNAPDLNVIVGKDYEGTCRLEGKKCYHNGTMPNGAIFDELWERVH